MTFVCPSCASSNRCPDTCAGLTVICRKCKTQITAPGTEGALPTSWLRSPKWLAAALAELLAGAALVAGVVLLTASHPPKGLPYLATGAAGGPPQLGVPGGLVALDCLTDHAAVGGYFCILGQNVTAELGGPVQLDRVAIRDAPWPAGLMASGASVPPPKPIRLRLELGLPPDKALAGRELALRAKISLEYPLRADPGAPVTLSRADAEHRWTLVVATEQEEAAFAGYLRRRTRLWQGILGCVVAMLVVAFAAALLAQERIMVVCPKCGRATTAHFYHEGSTLHISPCPHR